MGFEEMSVVNMCAMQLSQGGQNSMLKVMRGMCFQAQWLQLWSCSRQNGCRQVRCQAEWLQSGPIPGRMAPGMASGSATWLCPNGMYM